MDLKCEQPGDGRGVVGSRHEGERSVGDERLATDGERYREVLGKILAGKLKHEIRTGLQVGDIRVVALVEFGEIVDGTRTAA